MVKLQSNRDGIWMAVSEPRAQTSGRRLPKPVVVHMLRMADDLQMHSKDYISEQEVGN